MDYPIANKFSEALKYATPPCEPFPTVSFLSHLRDAAQFLNAKDPNQPVFRARQMYIDCLEEYLRQKEIHSVVPDEDFFQNLFRDLLESKILRTECRERKPYGEAGKRIILNTIRNLINSHFYAQKITNRELLRLDKARRSEALLRSKPPVSAPINSKQFVIWLHQANQLVNSEKQTGTFRVWKRYIEIFEAFLERNKIHSLVPDESFLVQSLDKLLAEPLLGDVRGKSGDLYYSRVVKVRGMREVRILVNRYFLPNKLIKRPILLEIVRERFKRFFVLTKNTQRAVAWFEDHGKVIKALPVYYANTQEGNGSYSPDTIKYIYRITDKKLLPKTVYGKLNHTLNFLRIVGKNGIEQVGPDDLRKFIDYLDEQKISQKQDYLAHTATFFINAHAEGFVQDHPFKQVSLKMSVSSVRVDFIPVDGINKLMDASSINLNDPVSVRNAVACRIGYDTGLRLGELYGLDLEDIGFDSQNDMYLSLDEDIQKGHKPKNLVYILFDETKHLLKLYLEEYRSKFKPKDNSLFVGTHHKKRICREALAQQMNQFLARNGIKTFYRKKATAHHLRHSLATLNIQPLGLGLSLYEVVERLRHTKQETAQKHYIHSNPYLQKEKFQALKTRIKKRSNRDILKDMPLSDLEAFLIGDLRIDPAIVQVVRRRHMSLFNQSNQIDQEREKSRIATLLSGEVKERIKHLGILFRSFTDYCRDHDLFIQKGRHSYFVDAFIDELQDEWVRKEDVMKTFGFGRRRFYQLIDEQKWPTIKIGNQLLVKAKHLLDSTKNRREFVQ